MSETEMKNNLFKINNDFYDNLSKEMIVLREKYINDLKFTCFSYARVSQKCSKHALFSKFVVQNSYGDIVSLP